MNTTSIDDFDLAIGFNADNTPVCLILMPESFYSASIDVQLIQSASLINEELVLTCGEFSLALKGLSLACVEAIDMGCPLVVIDNNSKYESLITINRH